MVWFKVDDNLYDHPKAREPSLAAIGLWTFSGAYASRQLTDGWAPEWFVRQFPQATKLVKELVAAGLWEPAEREGKQGWTFHDWLDYQPSAAATKARRAAESNRQKLQRDKALRDLIKNRDGNNCRYCRVEVSWTDRVSPLGGTYDHVDPTGDTSAANCVVSCKGCNSKKGHRTPRQAGMKLLPISSVLSTEPPPASATEGVTCWTPTGRAGSGSGRAGQDDVPDSVSYDPSDYELADLSGDG